MTDINKLIDRTTQGEAFQNCCQSYAHRNGSSRAIAAAALHGAEVPAIARALEDLLAALVSPSVTDGELAALLISQRVTLDADIVPAIIQARAIIARLAGEG